jgi:hypothetical protein
MDASIRTSFPMRTRPPWEVTAISELNDILYRLVSGEYDSPEKLKDRLFHAQRLWDKVAAENFVEISGLDFPVDPVDQNGQP